MSCEVLEARASSESETEALGRRVASALLALGTPLPAAMIFLRGSLGAGKTTLARGVLRGVGVDGRVRSPTYTLVETYSTPSGTLAHFDFYRLSDPEEAEFLGLREYLEDYVCLFEWPDKAAGVLPEPDLEIRIDPDVTPRRLRLSAATALGRSLLEHLKGVNQYPESVSKT